MYGQIKIQFDFLLRVFLPSLVKRYFWSVLNLEKLSCVENLQEEPNRNLPAKS